MENWFRSLDVTTTMTTNWIYGSGWSTAISLSGDSGISYVMKVRNDELKVMLYFVFELPNAVPVFHCLVLNVTVLLVVLQYVSSLCLRFCRRCSFCRNIPWVEVDLATWATEKKTFRHFPLSLTYWFRVILNRDTCTTSTIGWWRMRLQQWCYKITCPRWIWWLSSGYRKFNVNLTVLMPKGWRDFFVHNLVSNLISITLTSQ